MVVYDVLLLIVRASRRTQTFVSKVIFLLPLGPLDNSYRLFQYPQIFAILDLGLILTKNSLFSIIKQCGFHFSNLELQKRLNSGRLVVVVTAASQRFVNISCYTTINSNSNFTIDNNNSIININNALNNINNRY